ncbi:hypothetical protein [Streptomyces sp. 6N223]
MRSPTLALASALAASLLAAGPATAGDDDTRVVSYHGYEVAVPRA